MPIVLTLKPPHWEGTSLVALKSSTGLPPRGLQLPGEIISTPKEGGIDYHEHDVIKIIQPGGSKYVVRSGAKKVVIDKQ